MSLYLPSAAQLRETGSLKWTAKVAPGDVPAQGAWVAEMDFGTAPAISKRLVKAIQDGFLGYLPFWMEETTASALTRFQEARYGWVIDPAWVEVASSVMGAFDQALAQMTRPGSAVVVPTPAYMPFLFVPGRHGREVIEVPSLHQANEPGPRGWSLDLEGIRAGLEAGAGMVVLCNPWNPTGRSLLPEELTALHDLVKDYDALVFSDEIHAPLTYPGTPTVTSYASLGPSYAAHTITAVSASKAWNIPGLPAAQLIIPDTALRAKWNQKAGHLARGATALGLLGAITAYEEGTDWVDEVMEYVSGNLDLLEEALAGTAVDYSRPEATYLAWLGFDAYALDEAPDKLLLERAFVATNGGETLGADYSQWVRVNAAMVRPEWEKTVEQMAAEINTWPLK